MGQLWSSEEEGSHAKDVIGSVLYDAMSEGGAVPDLGVVHPRFLSNRDEDTLDSQARLQEQLRKLQGDFGNKAPAYLRDLIGRLTTFSDEPRLAGLLGLVVTVVMDMAYTSSRRSAGGKGTSAESSSCQRVWELQEVMEEYLKRCRINLSHKGKLLQDSVRLEAQFSLTLTQLKTCMLGGDCDSRSLRHWASGAAFHAQMLVHLAALEGHAEPLAARAALEQYKDDLTQILPAYRRFKRHTVCVVKCRGGLTAADEAPEEGSMTGLTVTDRETGKSVSLPLSTLEAETEKRRKVSAPDSTFLASAINLDLITSDQYAQAYLGQLFSARGPLAELENYFNTASDNLRTRRSPSGCTNKTAVDNSTEQSDGVLLEERAEGRHDEKREEGWKRDERGDAVERRGRREETVRRDRRDDSLKLSITETQPEKNLHHSASST